MRFVTCFSLLLLVGCAKPKPVQPPAPPQIVVEHKTYPKQTPKPGDVPVSGCTVTAENGNKADCICKKAATKIDSRDPSSHSLICK